MAVPGPQALSHDVFVGCRSIGGLIFCGFRRTLQDSAGPVFQALEPRAVQTEHCPARHLRKVFGASEPDRPGGIRH